MSEPLSTIDALQAENARLTSEVSRLREALQALVDEQNGPPLIKDQEYWEAAMKLAAAALAPQEANDEEAGNG